MSKFEHMSDERALNHAAMVGHLARGTIVEGKSYAEALEGAREAVGEDSRNFVRQTVADTRDEPEWVKQHFAKTNRRMLDPEYAADERDEYSRPEYRED